MGLGLRYSDRATEATVIFMGGTVQWMTLAKLRDELAGRVRPAWRAV